MDVERSNLSDISTTRLNLRSINLNNFATFNDQTITFTNHFNSIIGETGSGKSLILDALQLILGSRSDRRLVRKGSDYSTVEASFECYDKEVIKFFDDLGYPFENDEIIIKRIIYFNGKSKTFLNFQQCNLQILQTFAKRFIDVVGQFENQKLLTSTYQLVLLDHYLKQNEKVDYYKNKYSLYLATTNEISQIKESHSNQAQRLDYINYQIGELQKLNPSIEDEEEFITQKNSIMNIEANKNFLCSIENIFDSEYGLTPTMSRLEKELHSSANPSVANTIEKFNLAKDYLNEINYEINSRSTIEFDEEELNAVLEKLDLYQKLKRKFGTDTEGLVKIYSDFLIEKEALESNELKIEDLIEQQKMLRADCLNLAEELHTNRIKAAKKLSLELSKLIQKLNMKGATLNIKVKRSEELNHYGISSISFLAETNPGEGFHPVKEIASGGELSRILLALRQVLSSKDSISIFFFDEIDTGIGGETALKIGNALKSVSLSSQVIAITHLPQIANFSDKLIVVSKEILESKGQKRTQSTVVEVCDSQIQSFVEKMTPLS